MNKQLITRALGALLLGLSVPAIAADEKPWKDTAELSIVNTNGNSKTNTTGAKNLFTYGWEKVTLDFLVGGLGSKSEGVVTGEKYYASEKVAFKLSDRNYIFERIGWDKNHFAGFKSRLDFSAGAGRELFKNDRNLLIGEAGIGYITEDRLVGKDPSFAAGRFYSKYGFKISETANFSQDAEILHNFDDSDDYRLNMETAVIAALSSNFSLKASYLWNRVGKPASGFSRDDSTTAIALIANF